MPAELPALPPSPRRILVRGVNWLGDAIMTTPALVRLRERFPEAHITLLTPEKLADLWRSELALDAVVAIGAGEGPFSIAQRLQRQAAAEPFAATPAHVPAAVEQAVQEAEQQRQRLTLARLAFGTVHTLWENAAGLVSNRFDLALVLPNSPRAALEMWLARVPQRIGYARPWRNRFLTKAVPPRPSHVPMAKRSTNEIRRLISATDQSAATAPLGSRTEVHQVHDYLHLVAALGGNPATVPPRIEISGEEAHATAVKFGLADLLNGPFALFGLNPGAEYGPAKRWPAERFVEAAALIQRRVKCRWLVFGGGADAALVERMAADIAYEAERPPTSGKLPPDRAVVNLAGKTSLRELMALLKLCHVLLTNDTGPMHVAAALGTPVVVPFGSTSPELTGPGQPGDSRHRLLSSDAPCSPCFLRECPIDFRCMKGISAERVAEAVIEALNR